MPTLTDDDACTGNEGFEVEGPMVEEPSTLRVGRVVELEASIESISIDEVRAHPATHGIRTLQDHDLDAVLREMAGSGKTAQPCTHDDDSHTVHGSRLWMNKSMGPPVGCTMPP